MKLNTAGWLALVALVTTLTGCYSTPDGRNRMGMPFSKDKIESRYERPVDKIVAAAKEVLTYNGTMTSDNTITHVLEARIDNRTVWVRVEEVDANLSRVVVQARRKGGTSDIDLASEIDKQIALRLR